MRKERGAILKLKCSPSYMFGNSKYNSASVINTRGGRRDAFRLWDGVPRAHPLPQRRSSAPQSVPSPRPQTLGTAPSAGAAGAEH